jgi:hypothetical protein
MTMPLIRFMNNLKKRNINMTTKRFNERKWHKTK